MNTYVALLRGINVGGNNKIEMAKLKTCFESLGHSYVSTYINSGNVIFQSKKHNVPKLTKEIEATIKKTFALEIPVVLRSRESIETICKKIPTTWLNDKEQKTDVLFLWDKYNSKKTLKLFKTNPEVDTLLYVDGTIIWHLNRDAYKKSKLPDLVGTKLYKHMTIRNVNTVRKLKSLMETLG